MSADDTRLGGRVPAALRIRLKYADVDAFIERFSVNISRGGIFIASKTPKPVGTVLKFEFQLAQGAPVIRGEGEVLWVKPFDEAAPQKPHGMGVRFTKLDPESRSVIDRALAWKETHAKPAPGVREHKITPPPPPSKQAPPPIPTEARMLSAMQAQAKRQESDGSPAGGAATARSEESGARDLPREPSQVVIDLPREPSQIVTELPREPSMVVTELPREPSMVVTELPREPSMVVTELPREPSQVALPPERAVAAPPPSAGVIPPLETSNGADLDQMAAEWGVTPERIARTLARVREQRPAPEDIEELLRRR